MSVKKRLLADKCEGNSTMTGLERFILQIMTLKYRNITQQPKSVVEQWAIFHFDAIKLKKKREITLI